MSKLITALLLIFMLVSVAVVSQLQPEGPIISFNRSENATAKPATAITTAGGTFTTLVLNASSQNFRWKAYVGNITGSLALADSIGYKIYDWNLVTLGGEIYLSRNNSLNWSAVRCADNASIAAEETILNITQGRIDSINNTFNNSIHKEFYTGQVQINQSTCPSIITFVGGTRQTQNTTSVFQEILLKDDKLRLIYATPIEEDQLGYFQGARFDFQMIAPDYGKDGISDIVTYYMFVELS